MNGSLSDGGRIVFNIFHLIAPHELISRIVGKDLPKSQEEFQRVDSKSVLA